MPMQAGKMREIVVLQRRADAAAVTGSTWSDVVTLRARVKTQISGTERFAGDALHAPSRYQVHMRYRDGITVEHRLLWRSNAGNKILNITNVFNAGEMEQEMVLLCEEGLNSG